MEEREKTSADSYMKICIVQSVFVIVVILAVLVTKYFFKGTYAKIKNWYEENICVSTDVNEVVEENYEF